MNVQRKRRPSPAFVVAMIALFVGLGGTAGAVATQAVPLAKRALVADNAKKLGGQSAAQISAQAAKAVLAQSPAGARPAATASGLVTVKLANGSLGPDAGAPFSVACDGGQKVMGGGFQSPGAVIAFDSYPSNETTWSLYLANLDETAPTPVLLYATCLR